MITAAAAVGASHIVASTQAGALFGWQLWWLLIAVNTLKYPFFRFATWYSNQTGQDLMQGYAQQGRGFLLLFFYLNSLAAVVNTAGVLILTASLLRYFLPFEVSLSVLCCGLLLVCLLLLLIGRYALLDNLSKWLMVILTLITLTALVIAIGNAGTAPLAETAEATSLSPWALGSLAFLVALMGWMPVPIELAAISSLWLTAKRKLTAFSARQALFDFNLGYILTAFLALVFMAMGALIQYGQGQSVALASRAFVDQFVSMYASTIGAWSSWLVAGIAFLCMFGTTLAVLDGYSRSLQRSTELLRWRIQRLSIGYWLLLQAALGLSIVILMQAALGPMLALAMTLSFITTPLFAWLNYRLVRQWTMPAWLRWLARIGLIYLSVFAVAYAAWWLLQ
nr:divalent metal cation transporter [Idiomarina xiamenensis]